MKKHHIDFYSSIIVNGVESGYLMWGRIHPYIHGYNRDTKEQGEAWFIVDLDDPEYAVIPVTKNRGKVDLPLVRKALNKIINGDIKINPNLRDLCKEAKAEWDGGMLDAIACDVIIQVAVFGEIVYG